MPACEKCWADAAQAVAERGGSQVDHYHQLIRDRGPGGCTPREQCGEMHLLLQFMDGSTHCRCGEKWVDRWRSHEEGE
jgi:hypothetical protein